MAWDVTVSDICAESHIGDTATEAGATELAVSRKEEK